jgi:hypothetical protein
MVYHLTHYYIPVHNGVVPSNTLYYIPVHNGVVPSNTLYYIPVHDGVVPSNTLYYIPIHDGVVPSNTLYYIPVSTFLSIWDQFNFIEIMEVLFSIYMIKYVDIIFNNILVMLRNRGGNYE